MTRHMPPPRRISGRERVRSGRESISGRGGMPAKIVYPKVVRSEANDLQPIYLVCGVSGCGKSWAVRQVANLFHYIPHDRCWTHAEAPGWRADMIWAADMKDDSKWREGAISNHFEVLCEAVKVARKPVITECPFQERQLRDALTASGIKVIPIFVIESPEVVAERYRKRENKELPKATYTRASSILHRADEWGAFRGNSTEVFEFLKRVGESNVESNQK